MSELLNVQKLSGRISVPAYTIRDWAREGKIPGYKMGRNWLFDPEEVIEAIKSLTSSPDRVITNASTLSRNHRQQRG